MIIARSWVYLESVSSASTGGNSRGGGDGKTENNVVVVEEAANYVAMLGFHKLCCHVFIDLDKLLKRYVL
jgi:hypothetical protein